MTDKPPIHKAPADLGAAGRNVWQAIVDDLPEKWELDNRELLWLRLACDQADELALLQTMIDKKGAEVKGSTGQPAVNQAIPEARQARAAIDRLLGRIALPDEQGQARTSASQRGTDAARKRWRNGAA